MTDDSIFLKIYWFKAAIVLYQSSLERENFVKLKTTQLFYLVMKLPKRLALPKTSLTS